MSPMTANLYGVALPSADTALEAVLGEALLGAAVLGAATWGAGLAWAGRKVASAATAAAAGANERTRMKWLLAQGDRGDCATAIPSSSTTEAVGGVGRGGLGVHDKDASTSRVVRRAARSGAGMVSISSSAPASARKSAR